MDNKLKEILTKRILENISSNVKPVNYLTDVLDLGRESVYRRLNGQIDFSLDEILKLSTELNFSLDDIHCEYDNYRAIFNLFRERSAPAEVSFNNMLHAFCNRMAEVYNSERSHTGLALNRLLGTFYLHSEHLLKFIYYKWIHQFDEVSLNYYYCDLEVPEETINMAHRAAFYQQRLDKSIIADENILSNTIQEIKYYQDRGVINDYEISLIKGELQNMLDNFQMILSTGQSSTGAKWNVYLSSIDINSNSSYLQYDDNESVSFWIHSDSAFETTDKQMCVMQREWIESLKKYSTLITLSNQKMQADFLNQQYNHLDKL